MSQVVPARLPSGLVRGVDRLVRSGKYRNRSEVLKEGTRLLVSSPDSPPVAMVKTVSRLASMVMAWGRPGVKAVVLFGSAARGTPTVDSDVDLLVVVEEGDAWRVRSSLYELIYPIMVGSNLDISLMVATVAGWRRMVREEDPIVESILKDGQILWGRL